MKKMFFALMAVVAIMLTSCLGKTETPGTGDPQAEAPNEAKDLPAAFGELLKSGNAEGLFALVGSVQEKAVSFIKENPAKAKEYLETAQTFLKENAAKISELVGSISDSDMAGRAQELIKSVSEQPVDQLLGLVGIASDQIGEAQDAAADAAEGAKETVEGAVEGAKQAASDAVEGAKQAASDAANNAVEGAKGAVNDAVNKAADAAQGAVNDLLKK